MPVHQTIIALDDIELPETAICSQTSKILIVCFILLVHSF